MSSVVREIDLLCQQARGGNPSLVNSANDKLKNYYEQDDCWVYSIDLYENATNDNTKFIAAHFLTKGIKTQWASMPIDQREGFKSFITNKIITECQNNTDSSGLTALRGALVAVMTREWPQQWPEIVDDLISSATSSPSLIKNNLSIIQQLSQDVMEFSEGTISSNRQSQLRAALETISPKIFGLVEEILSGSFGLAENSTALSTLQSIVKWLSPNFIYDSVLLVSLCQNYLHMPEYQDTILGIFGEIACMNTPTEYIATIPEIFESVIASVSQSIDNNTDFAEMLMNQSRRVTMLIFVISSFLENHIGIIESAGKFEAIEYALAYSIGMMTQISPSNDVFKTCVDMWTSVSKHFFFDSKSKLPNEFYMEFFAQVRRILVHFMERPEEIIICENDQGNVVKEQQKNTATVLLHKSMHDALCVLTNIDVNDTIEAIQELITGVHQECTINNINRLSWSAGAVSGAIPSDEEKRFVLKILKELLGLFGEASTTEIQAVIASGIMYVCSRYPRFLMEHPQVLDVIIHKLIDFMHHTFEGIMDMAVDSFKTIAESCRRHFLTVHQGQSQTYLEDLLDGMDSIISDLSPELCISIFDAFSKIIAGIGDEGQKSHMTRQLMARSNDRWGVIAQSFSPDNAAVLSELIYLLKINGVVAQNVGSSFHIQFNALYQEMMQLYSACNAPICQMYELHNEHSTSIQEFKLLVEIKSSCLSVVNTFVDKTTNTTIIKNNVLPYFLESVVAEYSQSPPEARVPHVVSLLSTIITRTETSVTPHLPYVYQNIIGPTIDMIKDDFESYMSFREPITDLLEKVVTNCYISIWQMGEEEITMIYGSLMWGCKHPEHNICIGSLGAMLKLFQTVDSKAPIDFKNVFFNTFYMQALNLAFEVLTDTVHKYAFAQQVELIKKLLQLKVDMNESSIIAEALVESFPTRDVRFFVSFIDYLKSISKETKEMQRQLRDFLIELQQYSTMDPELDPETKLNREKQIQEENSKIDGLNGPAKVDDASFLV